MVFHWLEASVPMKWLGLPVVFRQTWDEWIRSRHPGATEGQIFRTLTAAAETVDYRLPTAADQGSGPPHFKEMMELAKSGNQKYLPFPPAISSRCRARCLLSTSCSPTKRRPSSTLCAADIATVAQGTWRLRRTGTWGWPAATGLHSGTGTRPTHQPGS